MPGDSQLPWVAERGGSAGTGGTVESSVEGRVQDSLL